MDKKENVTNGNSVWEDFKHWHKGFSRSKAAKYRGKDREFLEILRKELSIINNKIMRKNDRLPNVIFMSPKVSELIESLTTEDVVLFETEANGISVKNASLSDSDMDKTSEYRNIVQLWHPAREQPHCIGSLLCWRLGGTFFVHEHYDHNEQNWRMFISEYEVQRYCYIGNLEPTYPFD